MAYTPPAPQIAFLFLRTPENIILQWAKILAHSSQTKSNELEDWRDPQETEEWEPQARQLSTCKAVPYLSLQPGDYRTAVLPLHGAGTYSSRQQWQTYWFNSHDRLTQPLYPALKHEQRKKGAHEAQHLKSARHPKKQEDTRCIAYQSQISSEDNTRYTSFNSINGLGCI